MNRKSFIELAATTGIMASLIPESILGSSMFRRAENIPTGIKAIIDYILAKDPGSFNTDWYGTMGIESLIDWNTRAGNNTLAYGQEWLNYHIENDNKMSDGEIFNSYTGPKSRIIRGAYLPFTMYSGFFGLPFPCIELYKQNGDERAKQICLDVAFAILHQSARNQFGLVLHDDGVAKQKESDTFTIPDTIYFVTKALMIASVLDEKTGSVYRDQALYQIKTCTSIFLDKEKNIAHTVLFPHGLGKSYWCRASGWLAYALSGVLRYLPTDHPEFKSIASDLKRLADGVASYQGPNGGLRALINQAETPEETSATAMCIASIKEGVIKGWIPDEYDDFLERGWDFVKSHISEKGKVTGVYTAWAIPAEEGQIIIDQSENEPGWIPAVILHAANVMIS